MASCRRLVSNESRLVYFAFFAGTSDDSTSGLEPESFIHREYRTISTLANFSARVSLSLDRFGLNSTILATVPDV